LFNKVIAHFKGDLKGKNFAMWGLSFKPNTDDMRDAPSRVIIKELVERGAKIQAYDPVAMTEARNYLTEDFNDNPQDFMKINFFEDMQTVLHGANALIIVTEWKEFRLPNFQLLKEQLIDSVIFDGRNLYNPVELKEAGFCYYGVGRSTTNIN
jgi:UDPglucose 6-dehydrogenase